MTVCHGVLSPAQPNSAPDTMTGSCCGSTSTSLGSLLLPRPLLLPPRVLPDHRVPPRDLRAPLHAHHLRARPPPSVLRAAVAPSPAAPRPASLWSAAPAAGRPPAASPSLCQPAPCQTVCRTFPSC
ncbi:hypothetical protein Cadr_000019102 [Camelus dromedarius]|uniref:Uncharacterized protein n=1 Tax=Camelus dromedarius TaxID=9838 RepID=A0A5N4D112_CAMDR|nr:hypothetical protein Cadr_000019102 [Camelus dromedarius]